MKKKLKVPEYSAKTKAKYGLDPSVCPNCGSDLLNFGSIEAECGELWQEVECLQCAERWASCYSVCEIMRIKEGHNGTK